MGIEARLKINPCRRDSSAKQKMEAIKFRNWSEESFTWKANGVPHTFPAGMEIFLEAPKAKLFAKHLTDRELNRMNKPTNSPMRSELEAKCFPTDEVISESEALNIREEEKSRKKVKKVVVKEEEFAELKKKTK